MYLVHQDVLSFGTFARSQVEVVQGQCLGGTVPVSVGPDSNGGRKK